MRFTAKIILLTVSKYIQIFLENPFYFFYNSQKFERFEKSYCFSCIIQQTCYLQLFSINSRFFFSKNPSFFQNSSIYLTFLRNLSNRVAVYRVAFYSKLATINEFWKTETFFGITLFWKEPNFRTFWEISLFHLYSASFCLSSACFKKFKFRFKKKHLFFCIPQILIFSRNHTVSVAFYTKFATISIFWKFHCFFGKPIYFLKKPKFW